jgi:TolA-binding protein
MTKAKKTGRKRSAHPGPKAGTVDEPQGALVPMSPEELEHAGRELAGKVRELRKLKTEHAGRRSQMKKEREDLQKDVDRIAGTIAQQGR